ncbi:glycerol-3-phosphate dehydrogenase [Phaeobacter sp. 22II1-1F12B]|uniref:glycerol-3-phosphate dehydrogenase n=1 Tax=Phaeobacter sp. 22II1-1F12B TaxID=1317111 RepID=UPI000B5217E7|nr:glycerol-3-phosphate dehydrogenase [Phaeobacter sp. 22II1-1F12B]OWU78974.1 glycerol-3-phosphate dehydrogenase [Phaeobacter sp. 22II1-1F12B]
MPEATTTPEHYDLFVIGGGINGCGIARDAAGRGLRVGLAEMNDLASATSSASTKLFHGGLRYLEYFELRLVKHALAEREVLLRNMPHISWPMRFVLPYHEEMRFENETPVSRLLGVFMPWTRGRRPAWMIRLGLSLYDSLGGREILPPSKNLDLRDTPEGAPLKDKFEKAFEYSDCWVEDSRLVVLNARDAEDRGARIMTRTKMIRAERVADHWLITLRDEETEQEFEATARMLVNAGGPWVGDIIHDKVEVDSSEGVRLVRGSHIVTKRLYDHDKCYFFQGTDGRIIFAIPYESDFTLIGTTDAEQEDPDQKPECTPVERDYLINFANQYFKKQITAKDIVWTYSGVRPLYDDGASSATAATRDYTLKVDDTGGAPILNIFGGKITTYRKLAEDSLAKISPYFSGVGENWTADAPLPGGKFDVDKAEQLVNRVIRTYPYLSDFWARRMARAYGTDTFEIIGEAESEEDLGQGFGATLTEREVKWLMDREFARTAEDVIWRRSKLGLRIKPDDVARLNKWMTSQQSDDSSSAA